MGGKTTTLDLRETPPFERHARILDAWGRLDEGDTLRIANDHDPKPLRCQFDAECKGQFEWKYEKSIPDAWIVSIKKRGAQDGRKEEIKSLIRRLRSKEDIDKIKEKGRSILRDVSPADLAIIEQEIINEGVTWQEMRGLCDVHLEIMKESLKKGGTEAGPGHPIHTMMEEHKAILGFVDEMRRAAAAIKSARDFSDVRGEVKVLKGAAYHLSEAESHHRREEEALFPVLERFGVTEPPAIMREEHEGLRRMKSLLKDTADKAGEMPYADFAKRISEASRYLASELPKHIYKEDNILYPMALQVVLEAEWKRIKEECDRIGYCCFTPHAINMKPK